MRRIGTFACALVLTLAAAAPALAFEVKTLDAGKGEEVWYVADHSLPMIAMSATLPAGSVYDPAGKAGLAAFAADLADEGAGKLDSQAFQAALNSRGIRLSFTAGREHMTIQLVTLTAHASEAFRLLGLALSQPRFDASAVARVRAQILAALAQQDEDPPSVAYKGFYRAYFHDGAYGHPVDGDGPGVGAVNAGDLKQFARTHWTRGRLKIAVSGDVDETRLKTLLASAFGRLPDAPPPLPSRPAAMGAPGVHEIAMAVPQPSAVFGLPGLRRANPDFMAAYIADYILGGGGFSSRLMQEMREKRGLTYDVSTGLVPMSETGLWLGDVATKARSMRQTIQVIRATLRKFAAEGPSDAELADAKTYLTGSFPLDFTSNVRTAGVLNGFETEGLPVAYVQTRNAKVMAVTKEQVKKVARKLFNADRLTVVVAGTLPKKR